MNGFFLFFWLSPSSLSSVYALAISLLKQTDCKMYMHSSVKWKTVQSESRGFPLLLINSLKYIFGLGLNNIYNQIIKLKNVHALHCTFRLYIVPKGLEFSQLEDRIERGPQRKVIWWLIWILLRWPEKCESINTQRKWISRAILMLIVGNVTLVWGFRIGILK